MIQFIKLLQEMKIMHLKWVSFVITSTKFAQRQGVQQFIVIIIQKGLQDQKKAQDRGSGSGVFARDQIIVI